MAEVLDEEVDEPFILIVSKVLDEAAKVINENSAQKMQAFFGGQSNCLEWTS
ncbi:MAG: hypothetical protein WBX01_16910 [Nitrososphaeraceae archaeon]